MSNRFTDLDAAWLGMDGLNSIAVFITAGRGVIPRRALEQTYPPIEDLEDLIDEMKCISGYRLLVQVPIPDDFVEFARRGFFVFDWTDSHKTTSTSTNSYEKTAFPLRPIKYDELPDKLRKFATNCHFPELDFSSMPFITLSTE